MATHTRRALKPGSKLSFLALQICCMSLLSACQVQGGTLPKPGQSPPTGLKWYSTCGDPVCGNPGSAPVPKTCGDKREGQVCSVAGQSCDLGNDCHQQLICASSDPKLQPGGCPISKPIYKQDVRFLGPIDRQEVAKQLYQLPLASWRYRFDPKGPERMGFMIEADTPEILVKPDGNSVDLYGYTSMAVAAVQDQEIRVRGLEQRLSRLEARLADTLARCGAAK